MHPVPHMLSAWPIRWPRAVFDRRSLDRQILEDVILAHHARRPAPLAVLFIGIGRGQRHYPAMFEAHRFITVDHDPARARHGSAQGHVTACASALRDHFAAASFDLAVLNGVFGWGLNDPAIAEHAFDALHDLLRPGGELVFGWNDRPGRRPFDPAGLRAMQRFEPRWFGPLGCSAVTLPGWRRHRYEFFGRPPAAP